MQDTAILDALQSYKNLAEDVASHDKLLKDKTILLYAATMLENANDDIVTSSLEILSMLANHDKNHEVLLNTFGIFEALENVAINYRKDKPKLSNFASEIVNKLRQNAPPAYRTRLRVKNGNSNIRKNASFMYLLQVDSLNEDTRVIFESTLLEIKGVISFVVDMAARRCTIRIAPRMNVKTVISRIRENADMKTVLVTKNQYDGTEDLVDILKEETVAKDLGYFPEEDSPVKGKSMKRFEAVTKNATGFLKSAVDFWNRSFYW